MDVNKLSRVQFDSIYELGEHVDRLEAVGKRLGGSASDENTRMDWYGGYTLQDAITCATNGGEWHEGAAMMPHVHVPYETLSGAPLEALMMANDISGFAPNVPAYLSGVPDDMFSMEEQPASDKLLRVAVHVGRYSRCDQPAILNRGAAIMAVLDQLSREGYSIELWAMWRNDDGDHGCSIETCIKGGQDFWSPKSVAFALAHAAFQRRLCWRVAESLDDGNKGYKITNEGYGAGYTADFSDFDLSYPYVAPAINAKLGDINTAVEYIKTDTIKQLQARNS